MSISRKRSYTAPIMALRTINPAINIGISSAWNPSTEVSPTEVYEATLMLPLCGSRVPANRVIGVWVMNPSIIPRMLLPDSKRMATDRISPPAPRNVSKGRMTTLSGCRCTKALVSSSLSDVSSTSCGREPINSDEERWKSTGVRGSSSRS